MDVLPKPLKSLMHGLAMALGWHSGKDICRKEKKFPRSVVLLTFLIAFLPKIYSELFGKMELKIESENFRMEFKVDISKNVVVTNKNEGEIEGWAYVRRSNVAATCAGETVSLVPVTRYSKERIREIYGDLGYADFQKLAEWKLFHRPNSDYLAQMRLTTCDANGAFKFADVPDGDFFVLIEVVWVALNPDRSIQKGGYRNQDYIQRITLREGERRIKVPAFGEP